MLLTEAEVDELSRRLHDAISEENRICEAVGEPPLSAEELRRLTGDITRVFKRDRTGRQAHETFTEHPRIEVFSETERGARGGSRSSRKPLHEMAPEERRRAAIEASEELLPDLPGPSGGSPEEAPSYSENPAAWHEWKRQHVHDLLPDLPGTGGR